MALTIYMHWHCISSSCNPGTPTLKNGA